ncbi:MAG TPA: hypothetical protein VMB21_18465 [Candidatus Limnocylindria bacterium]|jgi:hypothetical protein|nr:hypothetical protein [Candidatus Limnocylindria bacterium]
MQSAVRNGYDASLALRAPGSAALTADATTDKVALDKITKSPRGAIDGAFGEFEFDLVLYLEAGFAAGADNTYTLNFNSYDADGANPVTHLSKTFVAADVGKLPKTFKFDLRTLGVENPNAAQFGIGVDVAGTTPSASFWAFIAPDAD